MKTNVLCLIVPVYFLTIGSAGAWGPKGHRMTAHVAVRKLPTDMPAFFRNAEVELGYLCSEPDRWRVEKREPALKGLADRDHILQLELVTGSLPENRYEFLLSYVGKRKPGGGVYRYRDLGFAPYAMSEHSEMLTVNFMLWRKARERTENQRRIKRQIEQNIIHIAGLLSHFITDNANPLHTTIHGNGWNQAAANPKGYVGKRIHGRFESVYVNQSIEERDFESLVGSALAVGPWLDAAMKHIRAAHRHVETVYALDQKHPFGEGNEPPESKRFTCERLAHASQSLRDFWYSAWIKSATLPERQ